MSSAAPLQHLKVTPFAHHSEEGSVAILGKRAIRLMSSKTYTMKYLWRADARVVSLACKTMVDLENGGL